MAIQQNLDTVGLRLRHARRLRKLNQEQLAKLAGVKQPSISEIETGETKEISGPNLLALCKALVVRPDWLISGEEPIEPTPAETLSQDERALLEGYRGASGMWRVVIQRVAAMRMDEERERTAAFVLTSSFGKAVSDDRLNENWTAPDKRKPKGEP